MSMCFFAFSKFASLMEQGVRIGGGCCGTTPAYIAALVKETAGLAPKKTEKKNTTLAVVFFLLHGGIRKGVKKTVHTDCF